MEKPFLDFYQTASKIWNQAVTTEGLYAKEIELSNELHKKVAAVFNTGRSYYMVFNVCDIALEFISPEIETVLGYKPSEMTASLFVERIHSDDKNYFLKFENKMTLFYNELSPEKRGSYRYHHDYRIKTKGDHYIRLLHQIVPLEYDEHNFYRTLAMHTDITHIKREGEPALSINSNSNSKSYTNLKGINCNNNGNFKSYGNFKID